MRVKFYGDTHLARTYERAARLRGFEIAEGNLGLPPDVGFAARDVLDHAELDDARETFRAAERGSRVAILLSQVPPGTTREWVGDQAHRVFYQVETIIMKRALERAYIPEQIVIGCADPEAPLPLAYQEYLMAFGCLVLQMSYESAEMVKCAINYFLAAQVRTTNELATAAEYVGANWADIAPALRNDARIGPHAYLRPGKTNQHLDRDVETVRKLWGDEPACTWWGG